MGLLSLRDKITNKLSGSGFSEEDVVYTVIEIRKYIERSGKDLNDPDEIKVDTEKFETIRFYRNWIAHPEKHVGDLSDDIKELLLQVKVNEDNTEVNLALEEKLTDEILSFCSDIGISRKGAKELQNKGFFESLKLVLHEQPVERPDGLVVGYDDNFKLIVKSKGPEVELISHSFSIWQADYDCWKCKKSTKVYALGDDTDNLLMNVASMSDKVKDAVGAISEFYFPDESGMAEGIYFMNHCEHCAAKQGDWFLHIEPDGPFWEHGDRELLSSHNVPLEVRVGF